jgi:hypothetical protein
MTVFDRIKSMSKDDLQKLIYYIYLWGHINEQCGIDDECFYKHLLNFHGCHVDDIISTMDNLCLCRVRESYIGGGSPHFLGIKFFSVDDAVQYLKKHLGDIRRIDDTTYATPFAIYKIMT